MAPWLILLLALSAACSGPRPAPPGLRVESPLPRERVLAIAAEGRFAWVTTSAGRYRVDGAGLVERSAAPRASEAALPRGSARSAALAGGCQLLPSDGGAVRRCGGKDLLLPVGGFPVKVVAAFRGRLYAGTFGGGLREVGRPEVEVEGVPEVVTALAALPAGLLCGTDRGLFLFDGSAARHVPLDGPPEEGVAALALAGDTVWVATARGALAALSGGRWRPLPARTKARALRWHEGRLWGVDADGAFWVVAGAVVRPAGACFARAEALTPWRGAMVLAGGGLLCRYEAGRLESVELPEREVRALLVREEGAWVAGPSGLHLLPFATAGVWRPGLPVRVLGEPVRALAGSGDAVLAASDRGVWLVPRGGAGLRVLLPRIVARPGALAASGDKIAVGTSSGVRLFYKGSWRTLARAQGLASDEVSALLFERGALWVGTRGGISRVELGEI